MAEFCFGTPQYVATTNSLLVVAAGMWLFAQSEEVWTKKVGGMESPEVSRACLGTILLWILENSSGTIWWCFLCGMGPGVPGRTHGVSLQQENFIFSLGTRDEKWENILEEKRKLWILPSLLTMSSRLRGDCRNWDLSFYRFGSQRLLQKCAAQVALRSRVKTSSRPPTQQRRPCSARAQGQSPKISVERLNYHLKLSWPDFCLINSAFEPRPVLIFTGSILPSKPV